MTKDRYKYFRVEARDILDQLGQSVLDLEKGEPAPDAVARVLRLAHTLKGAARVVKQREIADHSHAMEDALTPFRDGSDRIPRDRIDVLLTQLDDIGKQLALLTPSPGDAPTGIDTSEQPIPVFRPASDDLDALLEGVVEAHVQLSAARPSLIQVEHARRLIDLVVSQLARPRDADGSKARDDAPHEKARSLADDLRTTLNLLERDLTYGVDRIDRELRQVREAAERLRLTPASALFTFLERAVRDVAKTLGKDVVFTAHGGDVRVDPYVLTVVQGALLQMVRNAVAHGIEDAPAQRSAAGKPLEGRVTVRVSQRAHLVWFECSDDGRGIDLDAVRRMARLKGLSVETGATGQVEDLLRLLLKGGLSTSGTVTEMSGRGIGLDVVREAAERLGGQAAMRTDAGVGTTVELVVPVSLTSFQALLVETAGTTAAIPLDAVRGTVRLARNEIVRTETTESIIVDGQSIPLGSLQQRLSPQASSRTSPYSSAVILNGRTGAAALGVDRILGTASVVMRPLPDLAPATPIVAGVVLDAEGDPRIVLDADRLVEDAQQCNDPTFHEPPPRVPVLVVDDSLTTRMLERSILESAGYDVDLAGSGEEALDKARASRYALFLVDVEMPGMDGFTFIEHLRADAQLRDTPAILVTSRMSPEDQQRGRAVGAQAYIVKSDFDQGLLLERIRALVS
ncbi:MAG TPA: response regulator [Vicinamibacterales bacterium]|nr:response regulator [Vicinamibacterales bacterium]